MQTAAGASRSNIILYHTIGDLHLCVLRIDCATGTQFSKVILNHAIRNLDY